MFAKVTGGTSASAPEWAGVIALLNDIRATNGLPPLGFFNTRLYQQNGAGMYDVTQGNSKCAIDHCCTTGFPAVSGWDAMTGWGSPSWPGLVAAYTRN
jgi:tripeptidyl-peptidase-1